MFVARMSVVRSSFVLPSNQSSFAELAVKVYAGRGLYDTCTVFGKQVPYVIGQLQSQTQRTKGAEGDAGGVDPKWDSSEHEATFSFNFSESGARMAVGGGDGCELLLEVWAEGTVEDELIGKTKVELTGMSVSKTLQEQLMQPNWYTLDTGGAVQCAIECLSLKYR
jgi:hypothetical protein